MNFEFLMPRKVVFGQGTFERVPEIAQGFGKRLLVCAAKSALQKSGKEEQLLNEMGKRKMELFFFYGGKCEPTPALVDEAAEIAKENGCEAVLAIGGGSAMDIGKAAAAVAANPGRAIDYVEGIGNGKFSKNPLPFIAVPTTSGTGSEATKNSVVAQSGQFKNSIRDDRMLADVAVVDPEMTIPVPPAVTAASGADAVCQLIESYTTKNANYFTDSLALPRIAPAIAALKAAYADGENIEARETMSIASHISGICLANAGLGLAHGIAAALGAIKGIGHGIACGILMPYVAKYNAKAGVNKYVDIAAQFGKQLSKDDAGAFIADVLFEMNHAIQLPTDLKDYDISPQELDDIVRLAAAASSSKKNPIVAGEEEIREILQPMI